MEEHINSLKNPKENCVASQTEVTWQKFNQFYREYETKKYNSDIVSLPKNDSKITETSELENKFLYNDDEIHSKNSNIENDSINFGNETSIRSEENKNRSQAIDDFKNEISSSQSIVDPTSRIIDNNGEKLDNNPSELDTGQDEETTNELSDSNSCWQSSDIKKEVLEAASEAVAVSSYYFNEELGLYYDYSSGYYYDAVSIYIFSIDMSYYI